MKAIFFLWPSSASQSFDSGHEVRKIVNRDIGDGADSEKQKANLPERFFGGSSCQDKSARLDENQDVGVERHSMPPYKVFNFRAR